MSLASLATNACPVRPDQTVQNDRKSAAVVQVAGRARGGNVVRDLAAVRAPLPPRSLASTIACEVA